ncbi:hypothetical protein EZL74_11090 [Flavobacterium silvisoli]|uniref:Uncharacterized protein n=1 Tax=Flavobacterium silvisoli TaxID=2529433 RepID=A0A4V2L4G3_9FLAO|nr:hypothetical protein [Flavobacterium silvisoli]TBX66126.1 hypothetical protein EZL74_11090 [Flavobacterium silvisoli]
MIKTIKLYKQLLRGNEHMVIATPESYDSKTQRILVSVNNKVAEAIYSPQTKNATAKLDVPSTNANHPLASQLSQNPDMRVKVFVYDFIKDRILEAKLQEFGLNAQTFDYHATDEIVGTAPVILGAFDLKALAKYARIANGKDVVINGYWSSDKEGKKKITKANLGNQVFFHIQTKNIADNTKLIFRLSENDGLLKPTTKFPKVVKDEDSQKNKTVKAEIDKAIIIKNNKAIITLALDENWANMIESDWGTEIELQWKVYSNFFEKTIPAILNVSHSNKHLFLKPAYENYSLPELLTKEGDAIIFSISDFAKQEVIDQLMESAGELAKKHRYNLATRVLKSGKIASNIGEVYERKKAIYTYNVFTNEGKEVKLVKASNFGFKNKYVNNGKLVTTKGISQIDYFANIGLKNNVLKAATEITQIWDIFDLARVFFQDDFSELPLGYLGNPISFAYALLNEAVIKPTIQGIKDDWNKGLEEDFETIYKPKGLEACKAFSKNRNINSPIKFIDIFTPTLQKLLKNEFLSIDELLNYNSKIEESEYNKSNNKNPLTHTIFYKYEENKYGLNKDAFINCIFINDKFLNE